VTSISQDAFLFSGSVRFNLNPEDIHTDVQIYSALQKVDLEEKVAQMGGLDGLITERGGNLSSGEKQLFCLAR
jgi:ABC-type multidrug transport system fused ATPase/permease subunit